MRPISGFSFCAARLRIPDARAPLLVASAGSRPPGSPNLSPRVRVRDSRLGLAQLSDSDSAASPPAASLGLGSRALRNTVVVLTAKVIARLIALVTVLYMIRKLGPDQYGSF